MSEKIHIAQLIYNFHIEGGGGGITRGALELAENLDIHQFQKSVIALGSNGTNAEKAWINRLQQKGVQAWTAVNWDEARPYQSFIQAIKVLINKLSKNSPDILHSHSEFSDIAAVIYKLMQPKAKIMRTTHYGYPIEWRSKPFRRLIFTNFLYPILYNQEAGVNPAMRDRLNNRLLAKALKRNTLFVNEAVDLGRFENVQVNPKEKRAELRIPQDAFVIGCVGRLVEQKGHQYLLEAARVVLNENNKCYFLIVGDGPLFEVLTQQAAQLGISDRVQFTGARTDVEELLQCMDLFAMASLWEGMPIVIIESMSSGIPVITTNIPGCRDLIRHMENGWLVEPKNSRELSNAILQLLANPSLHKNFAEQGLMTAREHSMKYVAEEYTGIYKRLLGII